MHAVPAVAFFRLQIGQLSVKKVMGRSVTPRTFNDPVDSCLSHADLSAMMRTVIALKIPVNNRKTVQLYLETVVVVPKHLLAV